jgi:DeoR/GlpR family transcriptional regulator of sugar metabolism
MMRIAWILRRIALLAKCSMPTAQRDIKELVGKGLLVRNEGGSKNTSYSLIEVAREMPAP